MIQFEERANSPRVMSGSNARAERLYWLSGTDSEVVARSCIEVYAPLLYDLYGDTSVVLWRGEVSCEPCAELPDTWDLVAHYGLDRPTNESEFAFEISGYTRRIYQSLATRRYAPVGKTAPDFKGAIGVTPEGVEGVDITVPQFQFSETHWVPNALISAGYKIVLGGLVGRVNNAAFKGWDAGEVLMVGAAGMARPSRADWQINYRFAANPNLTDITVNDITGIRVDGWEYMWARYEDKEDAAAKALVRRATAVYVEQVYQSGDMSLLGIGV